MIYQVKYIYSYKVKLKHHLLLSYFSIENRDVITMQYTQLLNAQCNMISTGYQRSSYLSVLRVTLWLDADKPTNETHNQPTLAGQMFPRPDNKLLYRL